MTNLKYIDLFAGMGGFRTALDSLDMECVLTSEIDEKPQEMYQILHGQEEIKGDIHELDATEVPEHDILVGGITCQGFSYNGKRKGFDHKTGNLFFEVERLAKEKRPNFILIENVMGLLTHKKGETLGIMLKLLSDIGYKVDFELLNALHFGLPQQRRRVFIVATLLGEEEEWGESVEATVNRAKQRTLEMFPEIKTYRFNFPKGTYPHKANGLEGILDNSVDEFYEEMNEPDWFIWQEEEDKGTDYWCIKDGTKKGYTRFEAIPNHTCIDHAFNSSKTRRGRVKQGFTKTLDIPSMIAFYTEDKKWRRIKPIESFRLQGFSDEMYEKVSHFPRTQLIERPARSIPVPIVKGIGEEIQRMKDKYNQ